MASGVRLEFVPARHQEAVRSSPLRYKTIHPKPANNPRKAGQKDGKALGPVLRRSSPSSSESGSSYDEDGSDFEPFSDDAKAPSTSDTDDESMEDSERSDTESSESSEDDDDSSDSDDPGYSAPGNRSAVKRKSMAESSDANVDVVENGHDDREFEFYDINELPNDRGHRQPNRIYKSWHATARSPVGLENRGVTCYQNAAVQALIHLPAFGRYLSDVLKGEYPKVSPNSVTYELANLFKKSMERKSAMFPSRLLRRLEDINPMLDEWQQEDSHEYFMSLVGRLQEDSVPKGEKSRSSIIHDIFGGSVEQKVTCQRCHTVSTTTQDFYDSPVSFSASQSRDHYTLQKSMHDFFKPEVIAPHKASKESGKSEELTGGYQCERCKQQTSAVKQIAIDEAPEYLTVHIKRFKMDGSVSKKVKDVMEYPIEMSMTRYEKDNANKVPSHYKLVSVIIHEGRTVSSGHYIAMTRQPNNEWMMYDDESVQKVPESFVQSHPSAYILIYSRLMEKPTSKTAVKNKQVEKVPNSREKASKRSSPSSSSRKSKQAKANNPPNKALKLEKKEPKKSPKLSSRNQSDAKNSKTKSRAASNSIIDEIFATKRQKTG